MQLIVLQRWVRPYLIPSIISTLNKVSDIDARLTGHYPGVTVPHVPPSIRSMFDATIIDAIEVGGSWIRQHDDEYGTYVNYLRYEVGQGMGEHIDYPVDQDRDIPRDCVVSVTVHLSDEEDYKGGTFEVKDGKEWRTIPTHKGDVVVMASNIPHRVSPVTDGRRTVVSCFYCGPPLV